MRRLLTTSETDAGMMTRTLKAVVVPRPIAWVSSISSDGIVNLAPHSFFTVASEAPPIVQFTSVGHKDSLANVTSTGEFVVCLANLPLIEQVNSTGTDYPPEIDEFEAVGLRPEPSETVRPPRVADSPVAIECRTEETVSFGASTVVFGRVTCIAIDDAVLKGDHPDVTLLQPLARLGRNEWSTIGDLIAVDRIPWEGPDGSG
jgi:flavin reductase (DIM6/NTAB) family NADH-FMN oxidoreductase RutF